MSQFKSVSFGLIFLVILGGFCDLSAADSSPRIPLWRICKARIASIGRPQPVFSENERTFIRSLSEALKNDGSDAVVTLVLGDSGVIKTLIAKIETHSGRLPVELREASAVLGQARRRLTDPEHPNQQTSDSEVIKAGFKLFGR